MAPTLKEQRMTIDYDRMLTADGKGVKSRLYQQYYGYSDFMNFGYWTPETRSQAEASANMVEEMLKRIPDKSGTILDVACGLGATTRQIAKHYPPERIYAVNLSRQQLSRARVNAPQCSFAAMNAVNLAFPDSSIDNIVCVEAAFHFDDRARFYREAYRVLKPGGRLVTTDILFVAKAGAYRGIPTNYVRYPEGIRDQFQEAGYQDIKVLDVTRECWWGFRDGIRRWPMQEFNAGRIAVWKLLALKTLGYLGTVWAGLGIYYYLLTSAQKPETA
jgi:ubiquinone/menaquinone biosynthesis C-methylase UbiE